MCGDAAPGPLQRAAARGRRALLRGPADPGGGRPGRRRGAVRARAARRSGRRPWWRVAARDRAGVPDGEHVALPVLQERRPAAPAQLHRTCWASRSAVPGRRAAPRGAAAGPRDALHALGAGRATCRALFRRRGRAAAGRRRRPRRTETSALARDPPSVGVGARRRPRRAGAADPARQGAAARAAGSVPGGTVELGETLEEALVREMQEETGLDGAPSRAARRSSTASSAARATARCTTT